jgi:hypothetical protein
MTECSICLSGVEEEPCSSGSGGSGRGSGSSTALKCGHAFHKACINSWLLRHVTCPNCRCSNTVEAIFFAGDEFVAADMEFWRPVTRYLCEEEQIAAAGWVALTLHDVQRIRAWASRKSLRCVEQMRHDQRVFFITDLFDAPQDFDEGEEQQGYWGGHGEGHGEGYDEEAGGGAYDFRIDVTPQEPPYAAAPFL